MSDQSVYPRSLVDQNFGLCISPDDLIFPFYHHSGGNYYRPWKWITQSGVKDSGSVIHENEEIFEITLDVQHFKPNEINVKVNDSEVIIEGYHEERQDSHGFITRQFKRRYILPYNCLPETVECTLSSDGVLIITAKKNAKVQQIKEIFVPVQLCGVSSKEITLDSTVAENIVAKCMDTDQDSKKDMQIMLKEEHCRLLKPEFLGPAIIEANKMNCTEVACKYSEESVEKSYTATEASTEKMCEESVEKSSTSSKASNEKMYEESIEKNSNMEVSNRIQNTDNNAVHEIKSKAEETNRENQLLQRTSATIERIIHESSNNKNAVCEVISKAEDTKRENQILQQSSEITAQIISESSSTICTEGNLKQKSVTSGEGSTMDQIIFQSINMENKEAQEMNMTSEKVMTEEQLPQKTLIVGEDTISESRSSIVQEEKLSQSAISLELTSGSQNRMLEKVMIGGTAIGKTEEYKEVSEAAVKSSVSSTTAIQESYEETSTQSNAAMMTESTAIIGNTGTASGLSGMNATIEEIIEKCNAEMAEIANKIAGSNMVSSSEKSSMSMSYNSNETQGSSLIEESFSSTSSKSKGANLKVHDVIAELKDAAENI